MVPPQGQPAPGGALEELTLLAVKSLEEAAYAVTVHERLEETSKRVITMGAVYAVLDRLERKGLVRSALGPPTPARGGKRKRFFSVTAGGMEAVRRLRRTRDRLWRTIEDSR